MGKIATGFPIYCSGLTLDEKLKVTFLLSRTPSSPLQLDACPSQDLSGNKDGTMPNRCPVMYGAKLVCLLLKATSAESRRVIPQISAQ